MLKVLQLKAGNPDLKKTGTSFRNSDACSFKKQSLIYSLSTVACDTADSTPPTTMRYPAAVVRATGTATGAVSIAPAAAANDRPMVRRTLKNLGVGLLSLCAKFGFCLFIMFEF